MIQKSLHYVIETTNITVRLKKNQSVKTNNITISLIKNSSYAETNQNQEEFTNFRKTEKTELTNHTTISQSIKTIHNIWRKRGKISIFFNQINFFL